MGKRSKRVRGVDAFNAYYQEVYKDRWERLRESFSQPKHQVARVNRFALSDSESYLEANDIDDRDATCPSTGLRYYYLMDLASIWAACALPLPEKGGEILDLCAAPGGKSLILAERMAPDARLTLNELSPQRRHRLRSVVRDYLPETLQSRVDVTGHDGSKWGLYHPERYDSILLDAPCSSERHVYNKAKELEQFSTSRTKNLAQRQYALLAAAWQSIKPGGTIVYSTCSISPKENDGVVEKLVQKKGALVASIAEDIPGESTEFGTIVLPDISPHGPLYIARISKPAEGQ